ncbi:hypothetical protein [Dyella japonica]|uniref:hypothetical protein n=1 Tax=Dyella japonica TaxID=231455 RepID=UPI00030A9A71|nr:hypothetical protein [Dyella japonica]
MKPGRFMLIGVLLLAGCASTGDITHNKPTFQGRTAKLDSVYAACVQSRWAAISSSARIVETPMALQVVAGNATTHVEELLVIRSRAMGADVALYERLQILALRGYREAVKACL